MRIVNTRLVINGQKLLNQVIMKNQEKSSHLVCP